MDRVQGCWCHWVAVLSDDVVFVTDRELPGGCVDACNDETANGEGLGDVPVALHDRDGVVLINMTQERDTSFRYREGVETAFPDVGVDVEPVREPSVLIGDRGDVFGWVFGAVAVLVEDRTFVVGPVDELIRIGTKLVESVVVPFVDGAVLPQAVDVLNMVREPECAWW